MENKECKRYEELIFEYAEGGLAPEMRAELEKHFSVCGECSAKLAEAKNTLALLKESKYEAPDELLTGVMGKIRAEGLAKKAEAARRRSIVRRIGSAAAALLVVVGIAASARMFGGQSKSANDLAPSETRTANDAYENADDRSGDAAVMPSAGGEAKDDEVYAPEFPVDQKPSDLLNADRSTSVSKAEEPNATYGDADIAPRDEQKEGNAGEENDTFDTMNSENEPSSTATYTLGKEDPAVAFMKYGAAFVIENIID